MNKAKIVVVGSFNADITAVTPKFPVDGETIKGKSLSFGAGGKGTNQAVSAAKSGAEVVMVAKIGTDILSDIARKTYNEVGINCSFVVETSDAPTGSAVIEVSEESGENKIIVIPGANNYLSASDVSKASSKICECDVLLTQLETSIESVGEALRIASEQGKTTVLNPAPYTEIPDSWFPLIDYFIPNETETEYFTGVKVSDGASVYKAAQILLGKGVKNVIMTLGKKGACFCNVNDSFIVPSTGMKPVDTTGAGDCFCGAFCTALAEGKSVRDSILFANCAAGISVTRIGASASMPLREETNSIFNSLK
ncbi:MAG: ribokinase [Clostridia bacterium]|nr:ribokinase [Clostridia bacterium]